MTECKILLSVCNTVTGFCCSFLSEHNTKLPFIKLLKKRAACVVNHTYSMFPLLIGKDLERNLKII